MDEDHPAELPADVLVAVARVLKLLQRAAAEPGRSVEERLEFTRATLDLLSTIDPDGVRTALEPGAPAAVATWVQLDPEGWVEQVNAMSEEQRERLMGLLAEHGEDPPEEA